MAERPETTKKARMFVPTMTPQFVYKFSGAQSLTQIANKRPTMCIKLGHTLLELSNNMNAPQPDPRVFRLDKKKDHREIQLSHGSDIFTSGSGIKRDHLPDITVRPIGEGVFMVTPSQDLPPGEYELSFNAMGDGGYGFGITP
jgi:hypothetical protein